MKKYRLKKDLPDLMAGQIFEELEGTDTYQSLVFVSNWKVLYTKSIVENTSDWFEEVKEKIESSPIKFCPHCKSDNVNLQYLNNFIIDAHCISCNKKIEPKDLLGLDKAKEEPIVTIGSITLIDEVASYSGKEAVRLCFEQNKAIADECEKLKEEIKEENDFSNCKTEDWLDLVNQKVEKAVELEKQRQEAIFNLKEAELKHEIKILERVNDFLESERILAIAQKLFVKKQWSNDDMIEFADFIIQNMDETMGLMGVSEFNRFTQSKQDK